jgi:hypothetical protein
MKDNTVLKLGGTCAILLGITGALGSLTYLLLPADQRLGVPAARILPSIVQGSTLLNIQFLELVVLGVLGLAVVPAISELVRAGHEGWVRWTSTLASIGYAVSAISNLFTMGRLPGIAAAYVAGEAATRAALAPVWRSTFDLYGMWGYGMVGVWIFVVSLLALRAATYSRILGYLGLVAGVFYALIPAAFLLQAPSLFIVAAALGGIASTVWFIWVGSVTRHAASQPLPGHGE